MVVFVVEMVEHMSNSRLLPRTKLGSAGPVVSPKRSAEYVFELCAKARSKNPNFRIADRFALLTEREAKDALL